jgi:hypothetical protein
LGLGLGARLVVVWVWVEAVLVGGSYGWWQQILDFGSRVWAEGRRGGREAGRRSVRCRSEIGGWRCRSEVQVGGSERCLYFIPRNLDRAEEGERERGDERGGGVESRESYLSMVNRKLTILNYILQ